MSVESCLSEEMATYAAHREELLGRARGKYVLISRDRILGEFESRQDALQRGYEELGSAPYLVKQVVETEVPFNFTYFQLADQFTLSPELRGSLLPP